MLCLLASCGRESIPVVHTSLQSTTGVNSSPAMPQQTDMIGGLNYSSGKRLSYIERNRLQIETASESEGGTYYSVIKCISGLNDSRVTEKINRTLSDVSQSWCSDRPLPDSELAESLSEDVIRNACYGASTRITLNCSDYLSGVIRRTIDFYDPQTLSHSLQTYYYPVNFDLRSGEEFSLQSLFCSGADYTKVINSAILRYARESSIAMKKLPDTAEEYVFSLSEDGVVLYFDDSTKSIGIPAGTAITIDYSAFGETMVIERPCGGIYSDKNSAGFRLIQSKSNEQTAETVYYDEGEKLSAKVTHTAPPGFPETLFEEADNFVKTYIPDETDAAEIRESESDYLRLSCSITGHYTGSFCCIDLSCSVKRGSDAPVNVRRSYVYDSEGSEISVDKCFKDDFDLDTFISGALASSVNALMEDGWIIEEEIDINDIDFSLGSDSISISTLPVRMTRQSTAADGTEQSETHSDSIVSEITFEEAGIANLNLAEH